MTGKVSDRVQDPSAEHQAGILAATPDLGAGIQAGLNRLDLIRIDRDGSRHQIERVVPDEVPVALVYNGISHAEPEGLIGFTRWQ